MVGRCADDAIENFDVDNSGLIGTASLLDCMMDVWQNAGSHFWRTIEVLFWSCECHLLYSHGLIDGPFANGWPTAQAKGNSHCGWTG